MGGIWTWGFGINIELKKIYIFKKQKLKKIILLPLEHIFSSKLVGNVIFNNTTAELLSFQ